MPVAVPAVIGIAAILFAQDYYYLKEHQPTHEERRHGVLDILEKDIEWPTLAFFLFLFILVGAAVATGLIESLAHALAWIIDTNLERRSACRPGRPCWSRPCSILWVSGFLSAVIDNIPYTAVTIPLVASLLGKLDAGPDGQVLWWALALGACLGGNGTLIGASANVTVTGLAEKEGKRISFNEFTAFGVARRRADAPDVVGLSGDVALYRLDGGERGRRRACWSACSRRCASGALREQFGQPSVRPARPRRGRAPRWCRPSPRISPRANDWTTSPSRRGTVSTPR